MERLLVTGATELLRNLSSLVTQQIGMAWGVKDELEKLKRTLETIAAVTMDAEKQQEESEVARLWLKRLMDVVFDADNVLDEFSYEAMHQSEIYGTRNKVRQFFSASNPLAFHFKMAQKIRNINVSLDEISADMAKFHFRISTADDNTYVHNTLQQNRMISSCIDETSVLGRDNDKSIIVNMLTTVHELSASSSLKFSVVSIVGMGGIGKTTVAQMVYKDDSVMSFFDVKVWVCVSDDFNIKKILVNIIESVTNNKCDDVSNYTVLVDKVRQHLCNKKYLLVLDDLWNEDAEYWDKLKGLLMVGAHGSKVLVTTRSSIVASIVRDITSPYILKELADYVCWSIVKIKAFSPGGALETPSMTCIGEEIAKRCAGLPLAANVLGNILRLHNTKTDWLSVLDHDSLKTIDAKTKIISILKLSYHKLPSYLKLCFSYCSLFPKDWVIRKESLVRLWMAEGFLHPSRCGNQISLEDVGDDYFHSLLANSFFQNVTKNELGNIETCKMHDIVHDLAQSVSGVHDIKTVNSSEMESISEFRRLHLVLDKKNSITVSKVSEKIKRLKSVFSLENDHLGGFSLDNDHMGEYLLHGENLRVNCLLGRHNLDIPSIFKHKHLRYLDLSYCWFHERQYVSIKQLYNLQTLVLHKCVNVRMILEGIGSLKTLRHLDLSWSDVEMLPDSIVQLTNLQTLDLYRSYRLIALPLNIGSLKHLRELQLRYCEALEALPREVGTLTRLRCLDLSDTKIRELPCINNLCNLELIRFGNCKLPKELKNLPKLRILKHNRWNKDESMPRGIETLTCLEVLESYAVRRNKDTISCSGCDSGIIELANLNSLKVLEIRNLEFVRGGVDAERAKLKDKINLSKLSLTWSSFCDDDAEMVLEGLEPNSNLRELEIHYFPGSSLPKWMGSSIYFPNLVQINLWGCNRCEKLPALGLLPCLKVLIIQRMMSVKCLGEEFYYEKHEEDKRINSTSNSSSNDNVITENASALPLFQSLVHLKVSMENLKDWIAPLPIYSCFPSLEKLQIQQCPKLRSTPNSFPFLKYLELTGINSKAVTSIFATRGLNFLASIDISHSPELIYIPVGVMLQNITPKLQQLSIEYCSNFQGFLEDDDLRNYNNNNGDNVCDSYGDDFEVMSSFSCPKINSDSDNCSNSLCSLELRSCDVLTLLPDLRSFTSLRKLTILQCDKLKESIPYDIRKSLTFLEDLKVDFIQRED